MNRMTWLAASIALSMTVGYGARILSGTDTAAATPADRIVSVEPTIVATADGDPVMLPTLTVVVKVPAKRRTSVLASATNSEPQFTATLPELAVVVKIPAQDEVPAFTATLPELAVTVRVPAQTDGGFAMADVNSAAARRMIAARIRYLQEVREAMPVGGEVRWPVSPEQAERIREWNGAEVPGAVRSRITPDQSGREGALRPVTWNQAGIA